MKDKDLDSCREKELLAHPSQTNSQEDDEARIDLIELEMRASFKTLQDLEPSVSIFGSARAYTSVKYQKQAYELARLLSQNGFNIITGGGPGIMEAANKGAQEGKGRSVGLNIKLPHEQVPNKHQDLSFCFEYFFTRKLTFFRYSFAYIFMPGGYGTLDELFNVITLMQTGKIDPAPFILYGSDYWTPLVEWIKDTVLAGNYISETGFEFIHVTDDQEEILKIIQTAA